MGNQMRNLVFGVAGVVSCAIASSKANRHRHGILGQGQILPHRQFEIGSVVDSKVILLSQRENSRVEQILGRRVEPNGKNLQVTEKLVDILGRDAGAPDRHQQRIGDFNGPVCRHNCFITCSEAGQQRIGRLGGFIRKAPGQRGRSVDYKRAISICALRESSP